ncbi:hypothetical protein ACP70R_024767 [Stipagrostis hirtigluma subsp. patula]
MDTSGMERTFEEFDPAVEWNHAAEADTVKIALPGFTRQEIRSLVVDNHGHFRVRGERPVAGTKWIRFEKVMPLPADCDIDGIRAKFAKETLTITLPRKSSSLPQGERAPTMQQNAEEEENEEEEEKEEEVEVAPGKRPIAVTQWLLVAAAVVFLVGVVAYVWRKLWGGRAGVGAGAGVRVPGELGARSYVNEM